MKNPSIFHPFWKSNWHRVIHVESMSVFRLGSTFHNLWNSTNFRCRVSKKNRWWIDEDKSIGDILVVVPQGSILGPILFNIFLCDLFLDQKNNYFTNYADSTTYVVGDNTTDVLFSLTKNTEELLTWFTSNQMKANYGKCHLLFRTHKEAIIWQFKVLLL